MRSFYKILIVSLSSFFVLASSVSFAEEADQRPAKAYQVIMRKGNIGVQGLVEFKIEGKANFLGNILTKNTELVTLGYSREMSTVKVLTKDDEELLGEFPLSHGAQVNFQFEKDGIEYEGKAKAALTREHVLNPKSDRRTYLRAPFLRPSYLLDDVYYLELEVFPK